MQRLSNATESPSGSTRDAVSPTGLASAGALAAILAAAAGAPSPPPLPFTDVTAASGVAFVHHNGAYGEKLLPETMGGGVAVLDYDRDGDPDLLFVGATDWPGHERPGPPAPSLALWANDGAGRFHDATAAAGLGLTFYGQGVAVGDYDGDGWPDLYVTAVGPNHLLHNAGGRFEEATAGAGVAGAPEDWSTCAAFFDADGDGDLDLFVCNYLDWSPEIDRRLDRHGNGAVPLLYGRPQRYRGADPLLFRNDGRGVFTDVSAASGVRVHDPGSDEPVAKALGLVPVDVDRDGRLDLLVADDTRRNLFFHNLGPAGGTPRFEEAGELFGLAYDGDGGTTGGMGADAGELGPGDGLALAVGNFEGEPTSLHRAGDDPGFLPDLSLAAGLAAATRGRLTFGLLLFDADLDGRLDLFQANGHVETDVAAVEPGQSYLQPAQLFWNTGARPLFAEVPAADLGDLAHPRAGRGAAFLDLDGDGDLDLVLTQVGGPARLLRNDLPPDGERRFLRVVLRGGPPDPDALGARVEAAAGGVRQARRIMPTRSYLSQVEPAASFGLGAAERVESLRVTWPDGTLQELRGLPADRTYVIARD